MNFTRKKEPQLREVPINMANLAAEIEREQREAEEYGETGPRAYAPPAVRQQGMEETANRIKTFGELPTKEIDDMVFAAQNELDELKAHAQAVRDMYAKHVGRITEDISRLRESVKISTEMVRSLHAQCSKIGESLTEATSTLTKAEPQQ